MGLGVLRFLFYFSLMLFIDFWVVFRKMIFTEISIYFLSSYFSWSLIISQADILHGFGKHQNLAIFRPAFLISVLLSPWLSSTVQISKALTAEVVLLLYFSSIFAKLLYFWFLFVIDVIFFNFITWNIVNN